MTDSKALAQWVSDVAAITTPERVVWCDGSTAEKDQLILEMVARGTLSELDHGKYPGCFLHRSDPSDVARTEHLTFICCDAKEDAGPTNNWMSPADAEAKVLPLFQGAMKGRTMYVVPYLMGPVGSPFSKVGVELTDSAYVVVNMGIMTRMGKPALAALGSSDDFVKGLHSLGDLSPDRRFICHFPQRKEIWSIGSGYGGNALLGKKCFALRIASTMARDEGWLAEHMLITGIQSPDGRVRYIAAAFPSACGKTNLAMLVPPPSQAGWKVWTVGDDIAWLRYGEDGRLWAINPEAGFFGVVPGTSSKTNPNALASLRTNTIFTNVALRPDNTPWWEGHDDPPPANAIDWAGKPWTPEHAGKAAHPNSRFTAPAHQCPSISSNFEAPQGVPIDAIIFGGRRARVMPLVLEARDWQHGVFVGATMGSETTAAAVGQVGVVRRDPMAMLPFCGYNVNDYFAHWLKLGAKPGAKPPKLFHVNWFRQDEEGQFLWPGFGKNLRVLRWILGRCDGSAAAVETPIGNLPAPGALDVSGLDLAPGALEKLFAIDTGEWKQDLQQSAEFFEKLGPKLPQALRDEHAALMSRFKF